MQVLPEQILAVVIAVRGAHHGMHVIPAWLVRTIQRDRRLVVVFDHHHRRVDAVIKDRVRVLDPGVREPFERFAEVTKSGMRLVVVMDGDYAVMLRTASEG